MQSVFLIHYSGKQTRQEINNVLSWTRKQYRKLSDK